MKSSVSKRILVTLFAVLAIVGVLAAPTTAQAKTGWQREDGVWYYYDANGNIVRNGWATYNGKYYWMGPTCTAYASTWIKYNNAWYHLGSSGAVDTYTWIKGVASEGYLYGLNCDGGYYFVGSDGRMLTDQWANAGGYYCYFGSDGHPVTNQWVPYQGKWYHLNSSGVPDIHKMIDVRPEEGSMFGFPFECSGRYFVDDYGSLVFNSAFEWNGDFYYAGSDGHPVTNQWIQWRSEWFYAGPDGRFVHDDFVDASDGSWYYLDGYRPVTNNWGYGKYERYNYYGPDGKAVLNDMVSYGGAYYYFNGHGRLARDEEVYHDGTFYYFDPYGERASNYLNTRTYHYFGADGKLVIGAGWVHYQGGYIYIRGDKALHDGWYEVDGYEGYLLEFDGDGHPTGKVRFTF